jgi:hypothetical protein
MIPSERSKELLSQLSSKKLTLQEFLTECAYWAVVEEFDDLKPKDPPTRPHRVVELEGKYTLKEKAEIDWVKIYADYPEVKSYYDQRKYVENWNKAVKSWLDEMLSYIPEGDFPTIEKIKNRLLDFTAEEDVLEKAKETFS